MPTDIFFDAHLDLAMNARRGRDIVGPASAQPVVENEIATVGLPDLIAGRVRCVCATIFCDPSVPSAFDEAEAQFDVYDQLRNAGFLLPPDSSAELTDTPRAIVLIEGADCVRTRDDLQHFHARGARVIGLAWRATRYAGGTGQPGPLTSAGLEIVRDIDQLSMIHDASHLSEQSFYDLARATDGPMIASHSNCRFIIGVDVNERHLSDDMIRTIVKRDGVVGINFYDRFLLPHNEYGLRRATLADVVRHVRHVCDIAGDTHHVGIGTDMDGGLGREQIPIEITSSADLPKLSDALLVGGFNSDDISRITFGNWARFFSRHLGYTWV